MILSQAQSKSAHINSQDLIAAMPEMKGAQIEFKKFQNLLKAEFQESVNLYLQKLTL